MYKQGTDNTVTDALSRLPYMDPENESTQLQVLTSLFETDWADRMTKECESNPWIRNVLAKIESGDFDSDYMVKGGILYFQG